MQFQTRIVNGKPTIYFKEGISYIFFYITILRVLLYIIKLTNRSSKYGKSEKSKKTLYILIDFRAMFNY